jgi:glycogen(starch) synthase
MRILFLSNFYPPASRGGYEQWCQEVAEGLRSRGHEILVSTSSYGGDRLEEPDPTWVLRDLRLEMEFESLRNGFGFFTARKRRERENLALLRQLVATFAPEVILVWGLWNLPRSLAALAEELLPQRVVYYLGDYWPALPSQYTFDWEAPARNWMTALPKIMLRPIAGWVLAREKQPNLSFVHVIFPTAFMRDELRRRGVLPQESKIVYGAVDTSHYQFRDGSSAQQDGDLSLLYVGRLTAEKGVHTAIQALGDLVHQHKFDHLRLSIVGDGESEYEVRLRQLVQQEKVQGLVHFLGAQPKEAMPEIYRQADVFLFTSIWPEPFGRVLIEAMSSGVAIVGTATGGAAEILAEQGDALIFPPGDAAGLAAQIARLVESPSLRQQLARTGREIALTKFDMHRMIGEIEAYLEVVVNES